MNTKLDMTKIIPLAMMVLSVYIIFNAIKNTEYASILTGLGILLVSTWLFINPAFLTTPMNLDTVFRHSESLSRKGRTLLYTGVFFLLVSFPLMFIG